MTIPKIAVFCSGGGGNLQYLLRASQENKLFSISNVYVDRECKAEQIAEDAGIPVVNLPRINSGKLDYSVVDGAYDLYVLAGFLSIIPDEFCKIHIGKIINVHPSLLPNYGGKGMYGTRVHEAVIQSGSKITGATTHLVSERIDGGDIILQKSILVNEGESPWDLGGRVFEIEGPLLYESIKLILLKKSH